MNKEEKSLEVKKENGNIMSFDDMITNSESECSIYTNIKETKKLFNLESKVDKLLNDCENEKIRIKEVLIKIYKKPMKEPEIDEKTGEILKDIETTMSCVIVDDNNVSYATGSKMFAIQLMRYIKMFGMQEIEKGLEVKIVKNKMKDSSNKSLGFELL